MYDCMHQYVCPCVTVCINMFVQKVFLHLLPYECWDRPQHPLRSCLRIQKMGSCCPVKNCLFYIGFTREPYSIISGYICIVPNHIKTLIFFFLFPPWAVFSVTLIARILKSCFHVDEYIFQMCAFLKPFKNASRPLHYINIS